MPMELTELKAAIKNLTAEERRKIALYILELEKDHFQGTLGPQIVEDLEGLSRVVQESVQKIKKYVKDSL
jgi:signal transduction histidine kinase